MFYLLVLNLFFVCLFITCTYIQTRINSNIYGLQLSEAKIDKEALFAFLISPKTQNFS